MGPVKKSRLERITDCGGFRFNISSSYTGYAFRYKVLFSKGDNLNKITVVAFFQ